MFNKLGNFLDRKIWLVRLADLPKSSAFIFKFIRVLVLTVRQFFSKQCAIRASALTFFTLMSIVPIAALMFGVAKGYGFEEFAKAKLRNSLMGHEQVAEKIISFADTALNNASGGLVAGIGILVLIWTSVKLLSGIEGSFNYIWGIKQGRSFVRKLSDYIMLLVLFPVLIFIFASTSAFLIVQLHDAADKLTISSAGVFAIDLASKILPFLLAWLIFSFLYSFIPNTRVKFKAAVVAGIFTGTLYVLIQYFYMYLQGLLTSYNAIYGSFAALPFFLLWLQVSWQLVLLGAQLSFSVQNVGTYELMPGEDNISSSHVALCALRITNEIAAAFINHEGAVTAAELSYKLEIPIRTVRKVIYSLVNTGIITEVMRRDKNMDDAYVMTYSPEKLTPTIVLKKISLDGSAGYKASDRKKFEDVIASLWSAAEKSPDNKPFAS